MARSLRGEIRHQGGLATRGGLARRWGLSKQRLHQLAGLPDFPKPIHLEGSDVLVYVVAEADEWRKVKWAGTSKHANRRGLPLHARMSDSGGLDA